MGGEISFGRLMAKGAYFCIVAVTDAVRYAHLLHFVLFSLHYSQKLQLRQLERVFIMFSKIKHGFDMKGKRVVALLATITLLCSFTGCAGSEASNAVLDSVTSVLQSTHVSESKDSQDSETNSYLYVNGENDYEQQ